MLKRFLFILLLLGFVISVPHDVFAAPGKETKKERRERLKREKAARKRRQKTPPPQKKITPTFEEKLTPAQVDRKIKTIRERIETAPASTIPAKYKRVLLEVFDDMIQTQIGRYIFEKVHPDLSFCVKKLERTTNGTYGRKCISLNNNIFEQNINAKTPDEKLSKQLYLAHVIAHEATHSIQHVNNMNDKSNMSFEEMITINKVFELNSILNQTVVRYQVANLLKYRASAESGKLQIVPMHRFYKELFDAYKTTGLTDYRAHRAARTKFVETFWQNNGAIHIFIGDRKIIPCEEVIDNWQSSYSGVGFRRLVGNKTPQPMRNRGIESKLRRFTIAMNIDTLPAFFRNPETTPFKMETSKRMITYFNGAKMHEFDALAAGVINKGYKNGKLWFILIDTTHPEIASENRSFTDYHEGTRTPKATYSYKNGKMNGIYREYDQQGRQIMEVPVRDNQIDGDGWIIENGKKVNKTFRNEYVYNKIINR